MVNPTLHHWTGVERVSRTPDVYQAEILVQAYTESTDGSYIEAKESAIVWHYKETDPDFGRWQAKVG